MFNDHPSINYAVKRVAEISTEKLLSYVVAGKLQTVG
jgi:hypothetical protein